MKFIFFLSLSLGFAQLASAHPVIFKKGVVLSSANMAMFSDNEFGYSFHQKWSAGLNYLSFSKEDKNIDLGLLRLNHLLKRWNNDDSQANIYLLSGVGATDSNFEQVSSKNAYLGGIEVDWENRTLLTSLKYAHFNSPRLFDIAMTKARIGFSPIELGFDKLQTWFMLQAMHMKGVNEKVVVTPMIRLFYHNALWEMGSSTRGEWMFNFMVHI